MWLLAPESGVVGRRFIGCQWMGVEPKRPCRNNRIASRLLPPRAFIAGAVELTMVPATKRDRKFITDLTPECSALCKAKVVGVGR